MNMEKNKNITIGILVILLGLSLYFSFFGNDESSSQNIISEQDLFKQKQECGSYKNDVEKLLQKDQEFSLSRKMFDEMFYSQSLNTCLYSYTSTYVDADGKPMDIKVMGQEFVIIDYFTGRNVFSQNSVRYNALPDGMKQPKDLRSVFEEEKAMLEK